MINLLLLFLTLAKQIMSPGNLSFPLNLEGVTVPVEDVHHRGNWAKEFWTSSSIDEIQV